MGACLCNSHKELQSDPQLHMEVLQSQPGMACFHEGSHPPSNASMSEKKVSNGYDIGELATSSLMGLVATIKEHITKPTAMAQGRIAHLIEWKGWGAGMDGDAGGGDWRNVEQDEQLYSHLTDEIKEARFAAGVVEQFALAESVMNVWPTHKGPELASSSTDPLQDSYFLSHFLLAGGRMGLPQHLYNIHTQANNNYDAHTQGPPHPVSSASAWASSHPNLDRRHSEDGRPEAVEATSDVLHIDSSSLSEDDVFYN
ncbi:hypothetical protein UPYG_G00008940 [Umbra pygmaea]|uniref:Family with sequence similarity 131 member C n=1 Tax=Umbra pygmaea TaxID=75934 RepID=A0ABD0XX11_UMBPY